MKTIVEEISRSAPVLYPRLIELFGSAQLSLASFCLLSSLRHSGRSQMMRYSEVHTLLETIVEYTAPDVTRLVKELEARDLARRENLSEEAFHAAFGLPLPHERRMAIQLLPAGALKLDEFNGSLERLLRDLLGDKLGYAELIVRVLRHIVKRAAIQQPRV